MITVENVVSILRFYDGDSDRDEVTGELKPYRAVCTMLSETDYSDVVVLKGFHGNFKVEDLKYFIKLFKELGVRKILLQRSAGKKVPFFSRYGEVNHLGFIELDMRRYVDDSTSNL